MIISYLFDLRVDENVFLHLLLSLLGALDEGLGLAHGLLDAFDFSLCPLLFVHQFFAETAHDHLRSFGHVESFFVAKRLLLALGIIDVLKLLLAVDVV